MRKKQKVQHSNIYSKILLNLRPSSQLLANTVNKSCKKTAFIKTLGLFEFNMMLFGLRNAPVVFQQLIQPVLMGLNPYRGGTRFVSEYLDNAILFSENFEDHLDLLCRVIERLSYAGLTGLNHPSVTSSVSKLNIWATVIILSCIVGT